MLDIDTVKNSTVFVRLRNGIILQPEFRPAEDETCSDSFMANDWSYCWDDDGTSVTSSELDMIEIVPTIAPDQIVVNRQALLDLVCALDMGIRQERLPVAMDQLREPFFGDEVSTGVARTDNSMNAYEGA